MHVMEVVVVNGDQGPTFQLERWLTGWFQEGLASTVPQSTVYCRNNLWTPLTRLNGISFKNTGDCIQYTKTRR